MTENRVSLLDGQAWKQSLPLITGRPSPDAPLLKRLLLAQGELDQFWDGEELIQYMAYMELREGTARGNHFHRRKRELAYVISGSVNLVLCCTKTGRRDSIELKAGDLAMIQPGVAHAYETRISGHAVEFSPARFDPEDTVSHPLV